VIVEAARFPAMRTRRNLAVTGGIGLMLACALFAAAGIAQAPGPATLATPSSPLGRLDRHRADRVPRRS